MAPDTRARREARHDATEPATSAGSHDTVGRTTTTFGPPKEDTFASAWSDVSGMSYISPANVGFDPASPIAPYERPKAPTPGQGFTPSPRLSPAPFNPNILISDLLPSTAPSSCDFGTPKNFAHTPVFGPSPPFVPKIRGRAAFQARCETASPSSDTWSRFLRDFTTPDLCGSGAHQEDAGPIPPITCEPTTTEQADISEFPTTEPATTEQAHASESATTEQDPTSESVATEQDHTSESAATEQDRASEPANIEQAHVDAFTNWSLYTLPGNLLADFVSGILKFSQLDRNGNPVFVKDTDTNTSSQQQSSNSHKDVNAVHISQEEARIFVSMDQLRKEIAELQEHDEAMEREADKAHQEKARLELQLQEARGTCRKTSSDSAIGSDSDDDIRKRTQAEKLKRMQKRLDEANSLANSQHVHIDALTAERDELIKECHLAHEYKKVMNEQNQVLSEQNKVLNKENQNMKSQIQQAGHYFMSVENEVKHLNSENERLRQQLSQMHQQNDSLRQTRKSHSEQIKNLQSELEATRGQLGEATQDVKILVRKNKEIKARSEHENTLRIELEDTYGRLTDRLTEATKDIQALERENKEIKTQRDKIEGSYESLQQNYTVIRHKLRDRDRDDSTVNSVSSTGSNRTRRPASIQIRRTVPTATAERISPAARVAPTARATPTTRAAPTTRASSPAASDNEDHTIRPVNEPLENMKVLISTSESELAAMENQLAEKMVEFMGMNKGYNRRAWEKLHTHKLALENAIHKKSEQIYRQYDLLEGIRRGGKA